MIEMLKLQLMMRRLFPLIALWFSWIALAVAADTGAKACKVSSPLRKRLRHRVSGAAVMNCARAPGSPTISASPKANVRRRER